MKTGRSYQCYNQWSKNISITNSSCKRVRY